MDEEMERQIDKAYNTIGGLSTPMKIYLDVKAINPNVRLSHVREWFSKNVERKKPFGGNKPKNSFVAPRAFHEYQADLFYVTDRQFKNQEYPYGLSIIDIFSKKATVIPLKERKYPNVRDGLIKGFDQIGKRPEILYTDEEGALMEKRAAEFFEELGIQHIITSSSAHFVERFNRTFRGMVQARMEFLMKPKRMKDKTTPNVPGKVQWHTLIRPILAIYNGKNKHTATGMTPNEGAREGNELAAKTSMELRAKRGKVYPPLAVGDKVRVSRKKKAVGDKEYMGNFRAGTHTVESISTNFGQKFYTLSDKRELHPPLQRQSH